MSTEPISSLRRSNNHIRAPPQRGRLARPGHAAERRRCAPGSPRSCSGRAVRSLPVRVVFPGGAADRRRRPDLAGHADRPPERVLPPARGQLQDRVRRVLHGRGLDLDRSWPTCSPRSRRKLSTLISPALQRVFRRYVEARQPREEANTVEGSRENIHRHYDLSNELFALFLDETMSYSSAWFAAGSDDLADAQRRKIDGILDLAGVRAGQHILEIGTGWGGLATRAAQRGARVTTLTISAEQARLAEQRLRRAGVADRVQVLLRDYREAQGSYDAVVSVEMIEAVGVQYWPTYFAALDRLLKPGRPDRAAVDHHAARPDAGLAARLHLDPQVHLPGRRDPVGAGDRATGRRGRPAGRRAAQPRPGLRAHPGALAAQLPPAAGTGWPRSASTRRSAGCGSSTWPTARPGSASTTSTCTSSRCSAAETGDRRVQKTRRAAARRAGRAAARRAAAGPDPGLGRQRGRPDPRPGRPAGPGRRAGAPPGAAPAAVEPRRAGPGPGVRGRRARRRGRPRGRAVPVLGAGPGARPSGARAADRGRPAGGGPVGAAAGRRRTPPGRAGVGGDAVRRPAHPPPGPGRDRAPLRPVQRLLRVPARPAAGLLLRLLDPPGRPGLRPGRRPARQAGPDLPQARRWPRACGCWTSGAAGRRC